MKKTLGVGSKAPDFELKDASGVHVRLSETLPSGPVVVVFYPGDHTPGCTVQLCALRDDWDAFKRAGVSVFGINHGNADSHRAFAAAHRFPFPLLVDEGKRVSRAYGTIGTLLKASFIRRTVVGISPDGIIRYARRGFPKNAEILKAM
ncbi:MAG: peroxiredoxin, partial [Candidatus Uhrbacteria bacterium]|nr:peroxiredoxin [Candidatus Uhrbacteria bacterium]